MKAKELAECEWYLIHLRLNISKSWGVSPLKQDMSPQNLQQIFHIQYPCGTFKDEVFPSILLWNISMFRSQTIKIMISRSPPSLWWNFQHRKRDPRVAAPNQVMRLLRVSDHGSWGAILNPFRFLRRKIAKNCLGFVRRCKAKNNWGREDGVCCCDNVSMKKITWQRCFCYSC